ncbi:MAG: HTTM domain-containing protein [Polyangiales bacterium]
MNDWDRYWFGDVSAVRPWLLQRFVLLLLAFDAWLVMVEHGGRYGVGDFNVPHFGWMTLLQPTPTPGLYVGVVLVCGVLAFTLALGRPSRLLLGVLTALYTWAWAMSMLDSYQHHYLLSLLLLSMVFFPRLAGADAFAHRGDGVSQPHEEPQTKKGTPAPEPAPEKKVGKAGGGSKKERRRAARRAKKKQQRSQHKKQEPEREQRQEQAEADEPPAERGGADRPWAARSVSAWAYVVFGVTCAIVYFYTAVAKTEQDWREGHALKRITAGDDPFAPFRELFVDSFGMSVDGFWELVGTSVVLLQLVICAGYLMSVRRDTLRHPAARAFCWVALVAALSFHLGAEYLGLKIGWFSWYMVGTAVVYMLPRRALEPIAWVAGWPGRAIATQWDRLMAGGEDASERVTVIALAIGGAGLVVFFGYVTDLPGALVGGILVAVVLALGVLFVVQEGRIRDAQRWIVGAALAAAAMWASIASSTVRFDYYRLVGGDMRRRGNLEESLGAYVKANEYAPRDPAQDARGVGDCGEPLGWMWNGDHCVELFGCECEGADCDALSEDEDECSESFSGDRDDKEQELRQELGLPG